MAIIVRLDRMMADRKMSLNELADKVGLTNVNMSNLKTGKMKGIRFETLNSICKVLDCQPGEILEYTPDKAGLELVEKLEKELDPRSIAIILASMLLEEPPETAEEPDQIGFSEKKIRQLMQKEEDKHSKTHRGFGRTNRHHDGEEKHKSRKSNDFHRKDRKDKKHDSYSGDFKNRDRKFSEERPKSKGKTKEKKQKK